MLTREIAQPIIDFLSLGYLERTPEDLPLVMMWRRIIKQLDAYEKKAPDNSLSLLEDYLSVNLNNININKCAKERGFSDGDMFLKRRRDLQKLVQNRCLFLANENLQRTYNKMAAFFNVHLSGRYPFVERGVKGATDARAEDVNTFLQLVHMITPSDEEALEVGAKTVPEKEKALQFVKQVQALQPLLKSALDQSFDQSIPQVDFTVDFRTNKSQENLANQLVDFSLEAGTVIVARRSEKKTAAWQSGDVVNVTLSLAEQGTYMPIEDQEQPDLEVLGATSKFKYTGTWGLIRLLQNHQVKMAKQKPGTFRLRFQVPTELRPSDAGEEAVPQDFSPQTQTLTFFMDVAFSLGQTDAAINDVFQRFPVHAPIAESLGVE
ncbi:hypothetical protein OAN22_01390 [Alphaproteobacteria bacterium]|nr:hypothetical protein [Alphaproteobacteria bacterium]